MKKNESLTDQLFNIRRQFGKQDAAEKIELLNTIQLTTLKSKKDFPFVIKEAAILFETGGNKQCDKVITVVAPQELRIQRVKDRDKVTREDVLERIKNQWTDEMKISASDFVIENIDIENTKTKVDQILKVLNIL